MDGLETTCVTTDNALIRPHAHRLGLAPKHTQEPHPIVHVPGVPPSAPSPRLRSRYPHDRARDSPAHRHTSIAKLSCCQSTFCVAILRSIYFPRIFQHTRLHGPRPSVLAEPPESCRRRTCFLRLRAPFASSSPRPIHLKLPSQRKTNGG
jgi:hypothetical protein